MIAARGIMETHNDPKGRGVMKTYRFTLVAAFILVTAAVSMAQADVQQTVSNLDISAIKKMQIRWDARGYTMDVQVNLTNANAGALRLRNGEFEVTMEGSKKGPIDLGSTSLKDQIVRGKVGEQPGNELMALSVFMGPPGQATVDKLIDVFNLFGDPVLNLKMVIRGKSEVGLQLPKGWVYEQGKKYEVELTFTPAFQREFVLK